MTYDGLTMILLGAVIGALFKFLFDRWSQHLGWSREERKDSDRKIERVDQTARADIQRVERELKAELSDHGRKLERLEERVDHLPTADDVQELAKRLSDVDRGLSGVVSKVDGMNVNVKTILDHILRGER
ncbi:DUF2730 family protein [Brevundimonas aurantiaca]|jgi:exonuclease VII large subunit|uniref:DUF2730 family protein n=1 Tax=Brevundimonas aurantiaca TaxID=74316 RepID=UPI002FDE6991